MRRGERIARIAGIVIGCLLILVMVGVFVITQTGFGRDRVRTFVLHRLNESANGEVKIGRIEGDLLSGLTMHDFSIVDSAGQTFVSAERARTRYSLRSLISGRVILSDVELVRPYILLDRRPNAKWNFVSIFPTDTVAKAPDRKGIGAAIVLNDLSIIDGRLQVRTPWSPGEGERSRAATEALARSSPLRVEAVPEGYQSVVDLHAVNAKVARLRLADPDSADILADIDSLSTRAEITRPHVADFRQVSGIVRIGVDSLHFTETEIVFPATHLSGDGALEFVSWSGRVRANADPLQFRDLRWVSTSLPDDGGGRLATSIALSPSRTTIDASLIDLRIGESSASGKAWVAFGDTLALRDTDLRVSRLDTRLIEQFAPDLELPRHGTLDGRVVLAGDPRALALNADVQFTEPRSGVSRIRARGTIGTTESITMRDLRLNFEPVRLALIRAFAPSIRLNGNLSGYTTLNGTHPGQVHVTGNLVLNDAASGRSRALLNGGVSTLHEFAFREFRIRFDPVRTAALRSVMPGLNVGGTVSGRATLNGAPARRLVGTADLTHTENGESSHVSGQANVLNRGAAFDATVQLHSVSLGTVGRIAGTSSLHGQTNGVLNATGSISEIRLDADLGFANEGRMTLQALLDRTRTEQFRLISSLADFDLGSVTTRGPATSLTGNIEASGAGYSPETMQATFNAALTGTSIDSVHVDSIDAGGDVNAGLLSIDRARARIGSARLEANGTFGLLEGREGQLSYTLQIDTLAQFARFLPSDTTSPFAPRPAVREAAIARARADSARIASQTQVERMATGQPAPPELQLDSLRPIARDSLSGQVSAAGQISGGVHLFNLTTEATFSDLIARGHSVRSGRIRLDWTDVLKPTAAFDADATLDSVYAAGFALDRVTAVGRYQGDFEGGDAGGTVEVRVVQDARREYNARADLVLSLDQRTLRFHDLALRFDSTNWNSRAPGSIRWGASGLGIENLELTNSSGGRIFANGLLPAEGEGDLQLELQRVQIGDIMTLMQSDTLTSGLFSAQARLRGTRTTPRIESTFALLEAKLKGVALPDAEGSAAYATDRVNADARLTRDGQPLLSATATLPLRISFGAGGVRTLDAPLSAQLHADSLPLDALSGITPMVQNVQGRVAGDVTIGGTWKEPDLAGRTALDLASFRVVPLGVTFQQVGGALSFSRTRATIDSLVGYSDGPIRVSGAIEFPELYRPSFDLALNLNRARVLANDNGRVTANARLAVKGPLDRMEVTGDLGIHHGVIYIPEMQNKRMVPLDAPVISNVADTTLADVKQLIKPRNPLLENMRVDVALTVGRDTWVRNTDMNVEVFTPPDEPPVQVLLDQRSNTMQLLGTLHAERGEYSAFGRSFLLTRGAATFTGESELNPFIHLIAENEVRLPGREAIDIRVHLSGTMRQPTISLESDAQPPISQTDLLAYLAFGRSSTSLLQQQGSGLAGQGTGSGDLVGSVAALATSQMTGIALSAMLDEFESETARELKLDVFRITPADLVSEFSLNPDVSTVLLGTEIEVGKYFSRRWFIAARARARLVQPGARIEYLLPSGFRWVLSWEPRFLPHEPSFEPAATPRTLSVLGTFLRWQFRY